MVSSIEYIVQDKIWIEDLGKNSEIGVSPAYLDVGAYRIRPPNNVIANDRRECGNLIIQWDCFVVSLLAMTNRRITKSLIAYYLSLITQLTHWLIAKKEEINAKRKAE